MKFNGNTLSNIIVQKVRRGMSAPVVNERQSIPGKSGSLQIRSTHSDRTLEVDIAIVGSSRSDYLSKVTALAGQLFSTEEKDILLDDETLTYRGILDGSTNFTEMAIDGSGTLKFICQPYKRGAKKTSDDGTDTNAGTVPCPVKIILTLTADEADDIIISLGGVPKITLDGPFDSGDEIVIEDKYVTLNGSGAMGKVLVSSDFFELPKGVFAVTTDSANVTVELEWYELWL